MVHAPRLYVMVSMFLGVVCLISLSGSAMPARPTFFATLALKGEAGKIQGLILDANDARIVNATVQIENEKLKREIRSDTEGAFELELPSGEYQITIKANGFRKFKYPRFNIRPQAIELINIHLEVEPPKAPLKIA